MPGNTNIPSHVSSRTAVANAVAPQQSAITSVKGGSQSQPRHQTSHTSSGSRAASSGHTSHSHLHHSSSHSAMPSSRSHHSSSSSCTVTPGTRTHQSSTSTSRTVTRGGESRLGSTSRSTRPGGLSAVQEEGSRMSSRTATPSNMQMVPYEGSGSPATTSRTSQSRGTVVPGSSSTTSRAPRSNGGVLVKQQVGATEVWQNQGTGEVAKFRPIQLLQQQQSGSSSLPRSESRSRYSSSHHSSSHRALPNSASGATTSQLDSTRVVTLPSSGVMPAIVPLSGGRVIPLGSSSGPSGRSLGGSYHHCSGGSGSLHLHFHD